MRKFFAMLVLVALGLFLLMQFLPSAILGGQ
ncbi:MAG: hypothetical protein JWR80_3816 [Bradyrhizobium sp.]|nr:hypothetical protein [Bradyrhizobium sp.]